MVGKTDSLFENEEHDLLLVVVQTETGDAVDTHFDFRQFQDFGGKKIGQRLGAGCFHTSGPP